MTKNDIAIIALSFEFPGTDNLEDFWKLLNEGNCFYTNLGELEKNNVQAWGGVSDLAGFDYRFFGYSYKEACFIDPQHRHLLKHSYLALEKSKYINEKHLKNIGVYASASINRYFSENLGGFLDPGCEDDIVLGNTPDFLATRIAYKLGLTGPAMTIQTGCSSSLVNLHQARIALLTNQCDMALVGAVSLSAPNEMGYNFTAEGIRSKNGEVRPFDEKATGTVFTNGVAVLLLKRYSEALRDNDSVIGVIVSSAINNDGNKKASFTAPNISQQAKVINKALRIGQVNKKEVCLIEAHGTGTKLGDPIEFEALTSVYKEKDGIPWCAIQSVKANVGHMDTVSGFAGIIKACLVLKERKIPPQINFEKPNDCLNFKNSPFYVNKKQKILPTTGPLYAGVTALGIGGTNAHVILRTPDKQMPIKSYVPGAILFSAKDKKGLENKIKDTIKFCLSKPKIDLAAFAATTQFYREPMDYRFACFVKDLSELIELCKNPNFNKKCPSEPNIAFLFPGQGSQHVGMGLDLYKSKAFFKKQLDNNLETLKKLTGKDYHKIIFTDEGRISLYETVNTQVILVAFEVALAKYLISIGIKPSILMGHSLGEYTALVVSGVLDFFSAARLLIKRSILMARTKNGAMLSVFCDEKKLNSLLTDGIDIASFNSFSLITVSGSIENIEYFKKVLFDNDIIFQALKTEHAFHSRLLDEILEEFLFFVKNTKFNSPTIPIISNVTGKLLTEKEIQEPRYWLRQMREAVQFKKGIETLESEYRPHYMEVGPGLTLTTFSRQLISRDNVVCVNTLPHPKEKAGIWSSLYQALAAIWEIGINVNWNSVQDNINKGGYIDIPPYHFTNKKCWIEEDREFTPRKNVLKSYRCVWQQYIHELDSSSKVTAILILHDDEVLSNEVRSALSNKNKVNCIRWESNSNFASKVNDNINILGNSSNSKVVVINLLALKKNSFFDWNIFKRKNILFLKDLSKLIEKQSNTYLEKVLVLSSQAICLQSDVIPEKSILQGIIKTINQEKPMMPCTLIDMDIQPAEQIKALLKNIGMLVNTKKAILAFRNETFFSEAFVEFRKPKKLKIFSGMHIAIIGGMGSVGLQYVKALKEFKNIKLTFFQRRDINELLKTQDHEKLINKLYKDNNCQFIQADVGNYDVLKLALKKSIADFGTIDLLIHTAGVDSSMHYKLMDEIDDKFIGDCFYAKRQGLINIASLSEKLGIYNIHVVSSISSVLAGIGMYVYASLHTYTDNFVNRENKRNIAKWTTINWEAWEFGKTDDEPEKFKQGAFGSHLNSLAISPDLGKQFIKEWLPLRWPAVIVSNGDLNERYKNWVEKDGFSKGFNKIKDERPELSVSFVEARSKEANQLVGIWSDILGIKQVGIHDNFFELGGHSLMALQLAEIISQSFNKKVSIVDLFAYPTISKLSEYLTPKDNTSFEEYSVNKRAQARNNSLRNRKRIREEILDSEY